MNHKQTGFKPITNKQVRYDYEVLDSIEAGLVLTGPEAKSVRLGRANLRDSFVRIRNGQANVHNLTINPYSFAADQEEYDPKQTRHLLLHKHQIASLQGKVEQKHISLVPLKLYQKHGRFKLEVGIVRGKKEYQKREVLRRRDQERDAKRQLKAQTRYKG